MMPMAPRFRPGLPNTARPPPTPPTGRRHKPTLFPKVTIYVWISLNKHLQIPSQANSQHYTGDFFIRKSSHISLKRKPFQKIGGVNLLIKYLVVNRKYQTHWRFLRNKKLHNLYKQDEFKFFQTDISGLFISEFI